MQLKLTFPSGKRGAGTLWEGTAAGTIAGGEGGSSSVEKWPLEGWAPGHQVEELDVEGPGPRALPEHGTGKGSGQPSPFAITDLVPQAWLLRPEETQRLDSLTYTRKGATSSWAWYPIIVTGSASHPGSRL